MVEISNIFVVFKDIRKLQVEQRIKQTKIYRLYKIKHFIHYEGETLIESQGMKQHSEFGEIRFANKSKKSFQKKHLHIQKVKNLFLISRLSCKKPAVMGGGNI